MFVLLFSIFLAVYAFSPLELGAFQSAVSVQSDMLASTQALYAAEGAVEKTFLNFRSPVRSARFPSFFNEKSLMQQNTSPSFLYYQNDIVSSYFDRTLTPFAYVSAGDAKSPESLLPLQAKTFFVRDVRPEDHFNEIVFEYNRDTEHSAVVFELFSFPRSEKYELSSIHRLILPTQDSSFDGRSFSFEEGPVTVRFTSGVYPYKNGIHLSGLNPSSRNYMLHFQTLDQQGVRFRFSAFLQGVPMPLPNWMQTVEAIGSTPLGVYQRVRYQHVAEEGVMPGLFFVHFSDQSIRK